MQFYYLKYKNCLLLHNKSNSIYKYTHTVYKSNCVLILNQISSKDDYREKITNLIHLITI